MGDYTLKFLFANHDGVSVDVSFPETATGAEVKQALITEHWPEGKVETVSNPAGIRLLTMGKMMEDSKTLSDMKIPRYEHATPVNVSLLPKGKTYSEVPGTSSSAKAAVSSGSGARTNAQPPNGACCTIS